MVDATTENKADLEILQKLNDDYVTSVQTGNVNRFEEFLADDFKCTNPSLVEQTLTVVDKNRFLEIIARPVTVTELAADDVDIHLMGDVAIIRAHVSWRLENGKNLKGRYTDDYVRRSGIWVCISAHVTVQTC